MSKDTSDAAQGPGLVKMKDGADEGPSEVSRVNTRPPPFWAEDPAVWFAQVEGQFILNQIRKDETKYYYIVSHLEQEYASVVKDIITKPPDTGKYEKLKSELIRRLSASHERKIQQLLMHEELGDRKPSAFLRHLCNLAGPSIPEDILKSIWLNRLPPNLQTIVISQTEISLSAVAELADRIHDIVPTYGQVASTSAKDVPGTALDTMSQRVAELSRQVESLTAQVRNSRSNSRGRFGHARHRSQSRSKSRPRNRPPGHPHCFYHYRFGSRARNCTSPCSYKAENYPGSQ